VNIKNNRTTQGLGDVSKPLQRITLCLSI
jgi:hypothetical protein